MIQQASPQTGIPLSGEHGDHEGQPEQCDGSERQQRRLRPYQALVALARVAYQAGAGADQLVALVY